MLFYEKEDLARLRYLTAASHGPPQLLRQLYQQLANCFQVAVGSHAGVSYPFDLEAFCTRYGLQPQPTYQGLLRLQQAGLIALHSGSATTARVQLLHTPAQLYRLRVQHQQLEALLGALSRRYGQALFESLCPCSLRLLADELGVTEKAVQKQLLTLQERGVLCYVPPMYKGSVTFLTARLPAAQLPLDTAAIATRKAEALAKAEAVIAYVQQRQRCRQAMLLDYLGEAGAAPCGRCDVCREGSDPAALSTEQLAQLRDRVVEICDKSAQEPSALLALGSTEAQRQAIRAIIHELLAEGKLIQGKDLRLALPR